MTIEAHGYKAIGPNSEVEFDTQPNRDGFYWHVWLAGDGPEKGGSYYMSRRRRNGGLSSLLLGPYTPIDVTHGYIYVRPGAETELFPGLGIYAKGS